MRHLLTGGLVTCIFINFTPVVGAQDARPASSEDWDFLGRVIDGFSPPERELRTTGKTRKTVGASSVDAPLRLILDFLTRQYGGTPLSDNEPFGGHVPGAAALSTISAIPEDASGAGLNISRDGNTIVGYIDNGFFTPFHAFKWTEANGFTDLGTLASGNPPEQQSFATDVSDDGAVVVGYSTIEGGENGFRWAEASGMVSLGSGLTPDGSSRAYGVSGDGTIVVGRSDFPPPEGSFFNTRQPFMWTEAGGMVSLGGLEPTSRGTARAISADGKTVVGESTVSVTINNAQTGRDRAFRWTEAGGMQNLGVLPGFEASAAIAVSDDGSIVIGICNTSVFGEEAGGVLSYDNENARAFYWTEAGGMKDLTQLLIDAGVDVPRPLVGVSGMTGDGSWIAAVSSRPDAEFPEFISTSFPVLVSLTETLPPPSKLLNLSTRGQTLTGADVMIPGFVIQGSAAKRLLIRVVGPTLGGFGVQGTLADPVMTLKKEESGGSVDVATNDDWGTNANAAEIVTTTGMLGAFALETGSRDAALLLDLQPGAYTVVAEGKGGSTGVTIVEAYDADAGTGGPRLINISTRGFVGAGDSIMIPGFVVSDSSSGQLLIRAVGPGLSQFGVQGFLANPQLKIFRAEPDGSSTEIFANDDWGSASTTPGIVYATEDVGAFALPGGSKDAAIVVQLLPGTYTVQASGVGTTTGTALVEVYELP